MKCIKQGNNIQRVDDATATINVRSGKWVYISKSEWKTATRKFKKELPVKVEAPVETVEAPVAEVQIPTSEKIKKAKKAKKARVDAPKTDAPKAETTLNDFGAIQIPDLKV